MVLGLVLMDLVNGNSGVDDRRLNSLFLNDWLDSLKCISDMILDCTGGSPTSWT